MPPELPVDHVVNQILDALRGGCNAVLEAPPGAGKTTRVPPALLKLDDRAEVLVLEPRRIAARMAARRVAYERGEKAGETVGYQVRFEDVSGPRTRLRFLTEGVLTRRLLTEPDLGRVGAVVLDEFHERHLDADVALALVRRLQLTTRPDLKVVIMSATLDAAPIATYLGGARVVRSEGRMFDVAVSYAGYSADPLEAQVASALERAVTDGLDGDILVFLPGASEIRRAARACEGIARRADLLLLPLHGDLSPDEQDRAVNPAARPKVILSTNVAESSITIDGVTVVIDSGLARIPRDSPETGLPSLTVQRISQASAQQRAGRAGRTRPGRVIRLYTLDDYVRRPAHDVPEIHRRELSQVALELEALGIEDLPWFDPPSAEALHAGKELLDRLHASRDAKALARLPLHPRLATLVTSARTEDACLVAALLSSGDRIEVPDLLHAIDRDPGPRVKQIASQIRRMVRPRRGHSDEELRKAILRAFPDRVGRKQTNVQLSTGKFASIAPDWRSEFLVAIDIEDRREAALPQIRVASSIEPEWLLDLYPERVRDVSEVTWNQAAQRVEARSMLVYDGLVIEESRSGAVDQEAASGLLAEKALEAGVERFADPAELEHYLARVAFASEHSGLQVPGDAEISAALRSLAYGLKSFDELKRACANGGLVAALRSSWSRQQQQELDRMAPERVPLKGRMVKVNYVRGQQPWIASRLQDFFGLQQTPTIAGGKAPVLVHLLAPNQRPVQMTTDLAGFWARLYPQIRKELSRRYPKHAWPEKPN